MRGCCSGVSVADDVLMRQWFRWVEWWLLRHVEGLMSDNSVQLVWVRHSVLNS